jgi:hypothetical protein
MAEIKTDRDFIVHEQPNGDLWVHRRGGVPSFMKAGKTGALKTPVQSKNPSAKKLTAK